MKELEDGSIVISKEDFENLHLIVIDDVIQSMHKELITKKITGCPVCKQKVGTYTRPINDGQLYF